MGKIAVYPTHPYLGVGSAGTDVTLLPERTFPTETPTQIPYIFNPFFEATVQRITRTIQDLEKRMQTLESKREIGYATYILNSLSSKKLRLKKPLAIVLKETPEGFITELSGINVWGYGDIEEQAVKNLCADLENFYFTLKKEQKNLGKEMRRQLEFLQEFLQKKGKKK